MCDDNSITMCGGYFFSNVPMNFALLVNFVLSSQETLFDADGEPLSVLYRFKSPTVAGLLHNIITPPHYVSIPLHTGPNPIPVLSLPLRVEY